MELVEEEGLKQAKIAFYDSEGEEGEVFFIAYFPTKMLRDILDERHFEKTATKEDL